MSNDIESALMKLKPAEPDPALRERVRGAVAARRFRARSGVVLRWSLAALAATLAWAHVHEIRTAERMASVAAAASGVTPKLEYADADFLTRALLNPRMPMPLPQGYPSTRRNIVVLSIDLDSRDEQCEDFTKGRET